MAEQNFGMNGQSDPVNQVRQDIDKLVESFDYQSVMDRVEEFGRENPFGLAIGALALGVAAGMLMRKKLVS